MCTDKPHDGQPDPYLYVSKGSNKSKDTLQTAISKVQKYDPAYIIQETYMSNNQTIDRKSQDWELKVTSMTRYPRMEERLLQNLHKGWAFPLFTPYRENYYIRYISDVLSLFPDSRKTWAYGARMLLREEHRAEWRTWDKDQIVSILAYGQLQVVNFGRNFE